ncbi:MAG: antitoxin VapB family protein [Nanoarchaeota archaeon]|nr:antitoxin VapB family protein [Nanoarchaeota archaeon]
MGTKTITIMDDAYRLLVRSKRKDESFSDVVRRGFSKKGSILDVAGAWSDLSDRDVKDMEDAIKKSREYTRKHLMERIK